MPRAYPNFQSGQTILGWKTSAFLILSSPPSSIFQSCLNHETIFSTRTFLLLLPPLSPLIQSKNVASPSLLLCRGRRRRRRRRRNEKRFRSVLRGVRMGFQCCVCLSSSTASVGGKLKLASALICRRCSCSQNFDISSLLLCLSLASSPFGLMSSSFLLLHRQQSIGNPCGLTVRHHTARLTGFPMWHCLSSSNVRIFLHQINDDANLRQAGREEGR